MVACVFQFHYRLNQLWFVIYRFLYLLTALCTVVDQVSSDSNNLYNENCIYHEGRSLVKSARFGSFPLHRWCIRRFLTRHVACILVYCVACSMYPVINRKKQAIYHFYSISRYKWLYHNHENIPDYSTRKNSFAFFFKMITEIGICFSIRLCHSKSAPSSLGQTTSLCHFRLGCCNFGWLSKSAPLFVKILLIVDWDITFPECSLKTTFVFFSILGAPHFSLPLNWPSHIWCVHA